MRLVGPLALTVALAACGSCTDAGCVSGASLERTRSLNLPAGEVIQIRACVASNHCGTAKLKIEPQDTSTIGATIPDFPPHGTTDVHFTLRDASGRVVLDATGKGKVHSTHPNGTTCGPECRGVAVKLIAGGKLADG